MTKQHPPISDAHMIFLRHRILKMHFRGTFDVINLRRTVSKHCKTWLIGPRLGMKVKKSQGGFFCYIGETLDGITAIEVHSAKYPDKPFTLNVANNKEFMMKIFKHELL